MAADQHQPQKVAAILEDYSETLEVLTINSKPLINDLTMAADRYKPLAPQIIEKIESRLFEVSTSQKLPLLYLLDSIMKNLRGRYQEIINTKVVAIFCHCFEKLTEPKIRISLYKLRQTWNPFIVKKKLAAIDKHVHALDPNWPVTATDVTAPQSPTIHVNPVFLPRGGKCVSTTTVSLPPQNSVIATASNTPSTSAQQVSHSKEGTATGPSTLEQRRKQVLELQKRKKEQLKAKGTESTASTTSVVTAKTDGSLLDPRKCTGSSSSSSSSAPQSAVVASKSKREGKKSSLSPRKNLTSRSSLSPDHDSRAGTRRRKLSPRPRSASPAPSHPHRAPHGHRRAETTSQRRSPTLTRDGEGREGKGEKGISDILKSLDIPSLMGSIKQVKEQTQTNTSTLSLAQKELTHTESDPKVQPPPQKKAKLEDDDKASSVKALEGMANTAEDDDVIPKIKSSHLDLDDIPVELLPTHQEKIMKQVERQLKSGQLSEEQHTILVKQLDQLYALQRRKENGREGGEPEDSRAVPVREGHSPPPSDGGRTDHLSSDSVISCHSNHLPPPPSSVSVSGSKPPHPTVSDTDFHSLSPSPPHAPAPPQPHPDRHPHTQSQPPFDRYPSRQFPDYPRGPRPYQGRAPRGHRPFTSHPRHPTGPSSDWYPRGPPERWREHNREESPPTAKPPLPPNQGGSDPAQLFGKLVELGLIREGGSERDGEREATQERGASRGASPGQPTDVNTANTQVPFAIPNLTFTVATLKKPYSTLVRLMYCGDPCATCGLRFRDRKTADYSRHLDWHYKMNSRDKTLQRPRHWFLHPEDWLKFEESMTDDENREPLVLERETERMDEGGGEREGAREEGQGTSCEVLPGEEAEACTICQEQFEQFWEEELEEWHFREALREGGKLYHTYCYQDAKESGALDVSLQQPSPMDVEHKPLTIA